MFANIKVVGYMGDAGYMGARARGVVRIVRPLVEPRC